MIKVRLMVRKYNFFISSLILLLFTNCTTLTQQPSFEGDLKTVIDINQKHPNDKRQYKSFQLDNGLEVLLISDENANNSSAALDVRIGSLHEPREFPGMAHFLEHMLFLGTEKYPDVEEYKKYLTSHQGYANAYTDAEDTNYHFEVTHDGFEGSLDRFAQFFVAPLFNEEYVSREMKAVHSEHQKNLQDDYWRSRMVMRSLHKDGHPRQSFSTGDLNTLAKVSRQELIKFYQTHYSANVMKLAILSKFSLDQLETWVREKFTAVPNANIKEQNFDPEIFNLKDLPRQINIEPVKDIKKLNLQFATPSGHKFWKSKPASILSHLIGHEGRGSLLSLLKEKNLVTSLSTWHESNTFSGIFHVDMNLTDHGKTRSDEIIEYFFSYLNLLSDQGLKRYIFNERKTMAEIHYVYKDQHEGSQLVSAYARSMHDHPALEIDKNESLYFEYNREEYKMFLSLINPHNLNAVLSYKGISTDSTEKYYGTQYKQFKFNDKQLAMFASNLEQNELHLPLPNEFIPSKLEILTSNTKTEPYKLIDNKWGTFWFQLDDEFKLPKANVHLLLLNKAVNDNPQDKVKSILYTLAVNETLNEWNYDIGLAGLHYSFSRDDRGWEFNFSGFSENMPTLIKTIAEKVNRIDIPKERFEAMKSDLKKNITNGRMDDAYKQVYYEMKNLTSKYTIHRDEIYNPEQNIDLISSLTLDEVKSFGSYLVKDIAIEGSAFGSIDATELKSALETYYSSDNATVLAENERPQNDNVNLNDKRPYAYVITADTNNNGWSQVIQFGTRDPKLNAAIRVGHSLLKSSFYTELRTRQQLGYIVHSQISLSEKVLGVLFLIQSENFDPMDIAERVYKWKKDALPLIKKTSAEEFEKYKAAVASELREKDKTIAERHYTNIFELIVMKQQRHYKEKIAQAALELKLEEVAELFSEKFSDDYAKALSIYMLKKGGHTSSDPKELILSEAKQFKENAVIY